MRLTLRRRLISQRHWFRIHSPKWAPSRCHLWGCLQGQSWPSRIQFLCRRPEAKPRLHRHSTFGNRRSKRRVDFEPVLQRCFQWLCGTPRERPQVWSPPRFDSLHVVQRRWVPIGPCALRFVRWPLHTLRIPSFRRASRGRNRFFEWRGCFHWRSMCWIGPTEGQKKS